MTQYPDLFAALAAPFEPQEIRKRGQAGRDLYYITARTAMNRLDEVLGPENWWDHYEPGENSVRCMLTIRLPNGECLCKEDAGGYAGMPDSGDDDKSGYSDSFKRAAAKFGVSRYLYRDGVPNFVREREPATAAPTSDVNGHAEHAQPSQARPAQTDGGNFRPERHGEKQVDRAPTTGRALFAWLKEQEQRHEVGLIKWANAYMKLQDMPGRIVDLDKDQVGIVYGEAARKLQAVTQGSSATLEEALSN